MTPDHTEFKEFEEKWSILTNYKEQLKTLQIKNRIQKSLKEETVSFLKIVLNEEKNLLLLGDYSECAQIILILLGETLPPGAYSQKPGTFHEARWMSTILLCKDVCF
ncbi:hypothetical protein AVEN_126998-1 [Araneus ventricosus]|uniref:Uncharacterized protein n=1 Tax=Araneus ventricosus TaxID=182803 RepID=A0A4Y2C166_ARAVE|nr:hypothetical protein AVEN_126998-1 [Araneus ventricosus]